MISVMQIVILDAGMTDSEARQFLLTWKMMGQLYGEWCWVGRFYE